ncbi:MAG: DUF6798 domain-containing protein [Pirellulales bacterium]
MFASQSSSSSQTCSSSQWQIAVEQLLVWLVFLGHVGLLVPEVNEPYYLAKAKFFWNPSWCPKDFFLQTGDGHAVYCWMFGWLTQVLSLPATAIVGRVMVCGFLAVAWQRLLMAVAPTRWLSVIAAALFVLLTSRLHMAGEWALGGVESKGFAYAAVFAALAAIVRNRWNLGWVLLGGATALHGLVGGWALLATAFGWCWLSNDSERPTLRSMLPAIFAGVLIALTSVVPGLRLSSGVDPQIATEASWVQVFKRLPHHLSPQQFFLQPGWWNIPFGVRFALLGIAWFAMQRRLRDAPSRRLAAIVMGSLAIAILGLIIAVVFRNDELTAARLLRFYWFRLADVLLPAGAATAVVATIASTRVARPLFSGGMMALVLLIGMGHMAAVANWHLAQDIPAADRKFLKSNEKYRHWTRACDFARNETPADAIFIVPIHAHTFKWYADRADTGVWKEMPQDAKSVMDWWHCLSDVHRGADGWRKSLNEASPQHLQAMAARYNAQYVLTESDPPLPFPKRFENGSFTIYQLVPRKDNPQNGREMDRN